VAGCATLQSDRRWERNLGPERLGRPTLPMGCSILHLERTRFVIWPPSELLVWDPTLSWENPYR